MVAMHPKIYLANKEGFTLIEIMAALVIIGQNTFNHQHVGEVGNQVKVSK
jgi:prepilin-type N-terminal cleavage/methylation domain-containing protein